jgi:hypothetical protein
VDRAGTKILVAVAALLHSDIRVCASDEPKSGLKDPASIMPGKSTNTGNVLSEIESQGFRK